MLLLKVDNMIPNPTMSLIILTGILFALCITKFELTPSIQARYQTMFNLTPTSIILLNEQLEILEINQRANTYFSNNEGENFMSIFINHRIFVGDYVLLKNCSKKAYCKIIKLNLFTRLQMKPLRF